MTHFDGSASVIAWDEDGGVSTASFFIRDKRTQSIRHYREPTTQQLPTPRERFSSLVARWRDATRFTSSGTQRVAHPAYLEIIGMGEAALPLILEDLARTEDLWAPALAAISGTDPTSEDDWGDLPAMARSWLRWGRERGYCR